MSDYSLTPIRGMDNVSKDESLQTGGDSPELFARDVVNLDVAPHGELTLRKSGLKCTDEPYANIWQSPLHNDVFATHKGNLVKIDPDTWTHEILIPFGDQMKAVVVNNKVIFAGRFGMYEYGGTSVKSLTIDPCGEPICEVDTTGTLAAGRYGVLVTLVRDGKESSPSPMSIVDIDEATAHPHGRGAVGMSNGGQAAINVRLPIVFDNSVTAVRVYCTDADGSDARLQVEVPTSFTNAVIAGLETKSPVKFRHMAPMPTGRFLEHWNGRILTADRNIIRFSESMAFHIHDERFGYVAMPQRITFIKPVDGGIWVGQVTHVVFLSGNSPAEMTFERKTAQAPVFDSAIGLESDFVGDAAQGGQTCAVWLAANGYVLGTPNGQIIEYQSGRLQGISGVAASSVRVARRLISVVS